MLITQKSDISLLSQSLKRAAMGYASSRSLFKREDMAASIKDPFQPDDVTVLPPVAAIDMLPAL